MPNSPHSTDCDYALARAIIAVLGIGDQLRLDQEVPQLVLDQVGELPQPTPRRQRKARRPSIKKMIEDAEKAGKPLASITLADGTKLDFGKPLAEPENSWPLDDFKATKQ